MFSSSLSFFSRILSYPEIFDACIVCLNWFTKFCSAAQSVGTMNEIMNNAKIYMYNLSTENWHIFTLEKGLPTNISLEEGMIARDPFGDDTILVKDSLTSKRNTNRNEISSLVKISLQCLVNHETITCFSIVKFLIQSTSFKSESGQDVRVYN